MKDLVEFLIKNIVDDEKAVSVEEELKEGIKTVRLSVAKDDIGKVIGRGGRIIKAIRSLVKIKAMKEGKRVYLELIS